MQDWIRHQFCSLVCVANLCTSFFLPESTTALQVFSNSPVSLYVGSFSYPPTRAISRADSLAVPSTSVPVQLTLQIHSFPFQHPSGVPFQSTNSLHILEILNVPCMLREIRSGIVSSQMLRHAALLTSFPPGLCCLPPMGRFSEVQGQTG